MTYQRAIIIGAGLIAAIIVVSSGGGSTEGRSVGRYQIQAQANTGNVWMVDTMTGGLRLCLPPHWWPGKESAGGTARGTMTVEQDNVGANCSPWGLVAQ
jgi:hypothetical protein